MAVPTSPPAVQGATLHPWRWSLIGALLLVIGVALAAWVERAGGVSVSDVRFTGADGTRFSALLYRPAAATARTMIRPASRWATTAASGAASAAERLHAESTESTDQFSVGSVAVPVREGDGVQSSRRLPSLGGGPGV